MILLLLISWLIVGLMCGLYLYRREFGRIIVKDLPQLGIFVVCGYALVIMILCVYISESKILTKIGKMEIYKWRSN